MRKNLRASQAKSSGCRYQDGEFLPPMEMYFLEKEVRKRTREAVPWSLPHHRPRGQSLEGRRGAGFGVGRAPCQYRNRCAWGCPFRRLLQHTIRHAARRGEDRPPHAAAGFRGHGDHLRRRHPARDRRARARCGDDAGPQLFREDRLRLRQRDQLHRAAPEIPPPRVSRTAWATTPASSARPAWITTSAPAPPAAGRATRTATTTAAARTASTSATAISTATNATTCAGFGYQGSASRGNWQRGVAELSFGEDLKDELTEPGDWSMGIGGFGETLPYEDNRMWLDKTTRDKWGLPVVVFDAGLRDNKKRCASTWPTTPPRCSRPPASRT